jgi:hypothetical protein
VDGVAPVRREDEDGGADAAFYARFTDDEYFCDYLRSMQEATREELNRADTKAQIVLGIVGVGAGAVLGGLFAQSWSPRSLPGSIAWLWWVAALVALVSIGQMTYAVFPRTGRKSGGEPIPVVSYFDDVARFDSVASFRRQVVEQQNPDADRLVDQIYSLSRIVDRLYSEIRRGIAGSAVAVVLFVVVGVLAVVVS